MKIDWPDMPELNRRVYAILCKELGVANTLRFFSQLGLGKGRYVEERRHLFAGLTMDEYRQEVERLRKEKP